MPRLSIDITEDEHRRLKAIAAMKGQSLKDYVMSLTLTDVAGQDALSALAQTLRPRINEADRGELSDKSMSEIARTARRKRTG